MTISPPIKTLFLDIGGVLLTNGWDRSMRLRASQTYHLDFQEIDERHHLTFDTYELGKLDLDEYLNRVVFYRPRPFSRDDFKRYMFAQSQPFPEMIELIHDLKTHYGLKVAAISNEGRELTEYRIQKFELSRIIDIFICSCYVHYRKPDEDMYRIALDVAQSPADQVVYIEDRSMFVEVAKGLGIRGICHTSYKKTHEALEEMGALLTI